MLIDHVGFWGSVASIMGIAVAIIQTLRYKETKRVNEDLRIAIERQERSSNTAIWANIAHILEAFDRLQSILNYDDHPDEEIPRHMLVKVAAARQCLTSHYIALLRQAILREPEFNELTLDKWKSMGRLGDGWTRNLAMRFIETDAFNLPPDVSPIADIEDKGMKETS